MNRRGFMFMVAGAVGDAMLFPALPSGSGIPARPDAAASCAGIFPLSRPPQPDAGEQSRKEPEVLPQPLLGGMTVEQALRSRRSRRRYSSKPLGLAELSAVLFAAQGVTRQSGSQVFHTAPSAGALYPFDLYLFVHNVSGLAQGVYRYEADSHRLGKLREGDFRQALTEGCLYQRMILDAAVILVMVAVFHRTTQKYGERGHRYIHIEAGCICQNIYLAAEAMGLGTVAVGAFSDDRVNALIGLDGHRESAILVQPVGTL